jgi:hypothetical protein
MPGPYYIKKGETRRSANLANIPGATVNFSVPNTNPQEIVQPQRGVIDIVKDFVWTASPSQNTYQKIPTVYLIELEQIQNSLVSSALYYINSIALGTTGTTEAATDKVVTYLNKLLGADVYTNSLKPLTDKLKEFVKNTAASTTDQSILTEYLKSYVGIYLTKKTGFEYAIPYFDNSEYAVSNNWGNTQQIKGGYSDLIGLTQNLIDGAAATLNIFQPGTYVERPKYFQYTTEGESFTVSFPLFNTLQKYGNMIPYQQNYELIWLLAFQNKPYRTSFSRIIPPRLYNLSVPGLKYFPYCYLKSMSVGFVGTTRKLDVTLPVPSNTVIQAPIPEAYSVSLTFTSLLADTGNLMLSEGFRNKVKVKSE